MKAKYFRVTCATSRGVQLAAPSPASTKKVLVMRGSSSGDDVTLSHIRATDRNRQPLRRDSCVSSSGQTHSLCMAGLPARGGWVASLALMVRRFLENNCLEYSHQGSHEVKDCYEVTRWECITVFSAPNYCVYGQQGAFITLRGNDMTLTTHMGSQLCSSS